MSNPSAIEPGVCWWRHACVETQGHIIRYAELPDNPDLLTSWFERSVWLPKLSATQRWLCMRACIQLLLETYADTLNPSHWRTVCLDYLHTQVAELKVLAVEAQQEEELKRLLWEIRVTGFYFAL